MSRLITEPNSCIRSVISLRDAPALVQRASSKLWEKTGWSRRKDGGQIAPSPFLFQEKSPVSATLSSEAPHLRLRGNACLDEAFFSRGNFFPLPFLWLKRLHQPPPPLHLSIQFPAHRLSSLHLSEAFGVSRFFFFFFFLFCNERVRKINFWVITLSLQGHLHTEKGSSFSYEEKDGLIRLKVADMGCSGSQVLVFLCRTPLKASLWPVFGFLRSRGSVG